MKDNSRCFTRYSGFDSPHTIVVLPVGTANARFKQRAKLYNMLGMFIDGYCFSFLSLCIANSGTILNRGFLKTGA